jgi:hypothetical protein
MTRGFIVSFGLLAVCIGCGSPSANVQGTVTIDGQLAQNGTVVFHPVDEGPTAYGSIDKNGNYSLRVGQGDLSDPNAGQVEMGEYIVTVVVNMPSRPDDVEGEAAPPTPGARLSAEKYSNKDTSPLRHTVSGGANVVPLEIEGAVAEEAEVADGEDETTPPAEDAAVAPDDAAPDASSEASALVTEPTTEAPEETPQEETQQSTPAEPPANVEEQKQ